MDEVVLRSRPEIREYTIFVSSGDDALSLRNRVTALIEEVFSPLLRRMGLPFRLQVERWEREPAQRAPGGNPNAIFVEKARQSDLTLVLLRDRLGPGTREEIEGIADREDVELSILWFPSGSAEATGLPAAENAETFLRGQSEALYARCEDSGSESSWHIILRPILLLMLRVFAEEENRETLVERR